MSRLKHGKEGNVCLPGVVRYAEVIEVMIVARVNAKGHCHHARVASPLPISAIEPVESGGGLSPRAPWSD